MQDWTWQRHGSAGESGQPDPPAGAPAAGAVGGPVGGLTDEAAGTAEPAGTNDTDETDDIDDAEEAEDTARDIRVAGPPKPSLAEAAAAVPRPTATREGSRDRRHAAQLMDPAAAKRFQGRWRDVQAGFVDDPQDATRQADALAGEAIEALLEALGTRRRDLGGRWRSDGAERPDTEQLRLALLAYRDFVDRILGA